MLAPPAAFLARLRLWFDLAAHGFKTTLHFADDQVRGVVTLPVGLHGTFYYAGKTMILQPGAQSIAL